ncbi:DUF2335 domain-containing protein [Photorhabdus sp. SF281]|uniref:DUF2335 domain-containing protein n=1 Tax=Photorhabdus sp. SF281 TaxID=3459527 RepID=UPI004044136A
MHKRRSPSTKKPDQIINQSTPSSSDAKDSKTELLVNEVIKNPEVLQKLALRPEGIGMIMQVTTLRSGPLPDADELSKYDQIYPGLAKEIVDMARSAQHFRQEQGRKSLSGDIWKDRIGQIFALLCVLIISGVAVYMIYRGESGYANTLMTTVLASLAGVFIYGRYENSKDTSSKNKKKPSKK